MRRLPLTIVPDANVVAKWVLAEPDSPVAEAVAVGRVLLAPDLMLVECSNILWKNVRRGLLTGEEAEHALTLLQDVGFHLTRDADLLSDAHRLAGDLGHPVYDCLYLALAQRHGVPVITADRRFAALGERSPELAATLVPLSALA